MQPMTYSWTNKKLSSLKVPCNLQVDTNTGVCGIEHLLAVICNLPHEILRALKTEKAHEGVSENCLC